MMSDPIPQARLEQVEGITVVHIEDRQKLWTDLEVAELGDYLIELVERPEYRQLVLDLARVPNVTSAALGKLVSLRRKLARLGGAVRLCHVQPGLLEVLRITRLDTVFGIDADLDAACAALQSAGPTADASRTEPGHAPTTPAKPEPSS